MCSRVPSSSRIELGSIIDRLLDVDSLAALREADAALMCGNVLMAHGERKCVMASFAQVLGGSQSTWRRRASRLAPVIGGSRQAMKKTRCFGRRLPFAPIGLVPSPQVLGLISHRRTRGEMLLFCRWVPTIGERRVRFMKYHVLFALMSALESKCIELSEVEWRLIADAAATGDDIGVCIAATTVLFWSADRSLVDNAIAAIVDSFSSRFLYAERFGDTPVDVLPFLTPALPADIATAHADNFHALRDALSLGNAYCHRSALFLHCAFTRGLHPMDHIETFTASIQLGLPSKEKSDSREWTRIGIYAYGGLAECLPSARAALESCSDTALHDLRRMFKHGKALETVVKATMHYGATDGLVPLVSRFLKRWQAWTEVTGQPNFLRDANIPENVRYRAPH